MDLKNPVKKFKISLVTKVRVNGFMMSPDKETCETFMKKSIEGKLIDPDQEMTFDDWEIESIKEVHRED